MVGVEPTHKVPLQLLGSLEDVVNVGDSAALSAVACGTEGGPLRENQNGRRRT